jgi:pyrrolidone-carboxylate peptidase
VSTVEEQRAHQPIPTAILAGSPLRALVDRVLAGAGDDPAALGAQLWQEAVAAGGDDRPLYWARLQISAALRDRGVDPGPFELAARGMTGDGPADVLLTGFDPYRLDEDVRRGNPSGAIALAYHGRLVAGRRIRTIIFPVRYADFDDLLVERALEPYVDRATWIVTVSQGRPDQFDLEVWNGRRRSNGRPDNAEEFGGGTDTAPVAPPGMPEGPEFVAATLPFPALAKATDGAYPVRVNHTLTQLVPGGLPHDDTRPHPDALAVAGSGGGFLSNEIAYRSTRLLAARASGTLGGHVHTPLLPTPPDEELTGTEMTQARADIVSQFGDLLRAGLGDSEEPA